MKNLNILGALKWRLQLAIEKRRNIKLLQFLSGEYGIVFPHHRSVSAADYFVIKEVFVEKAYADFFPFYQNAVVLDIGAHKGYFILWAIKNLELDSRICGIEASSSNYKQLRKNLESNKCDNVSTIHAAVCSSERGETCKLSLVRDINNSICTPGTGFFESVPAMSLEKALSRFNVDRVDFLKMDVEGAEYEILSSSSKETLQRISVISLEFHDLKKPEHTANALRKRLGDSGFEIVKAAHGPSIHNSNGGKLVAVRKNVL